MRAGLYQTVHSVFAVTVTVAFLASIFVAPLVSAALVVAATVYGGWTIWHVIALGHLLIIALAIYTLGPAFRRPRFSASPEF